MQIYNLPSLAHRYPKPSYPMLPYIDKNFLSFNKRQYIQSTSRFFKDDVIFLKKGRSAIFQILKLKNFDNNRSEVLLPAYHCASMVAPIVKAGFKVVFFKLDQNIERTRENIQNKVTQNTKAVVFPHLFGEVKNLSAIRRFCDEKTILLIEDCAHALYCDITALDKPGFQGHFAIASLGKFLPVSHGGALVSNIGTTCLSELKNSLHCPNILDELRVGKNLIDVSRYFKRKSVDLNELTFPGESDEIVTEDSKQFIADHWIQVDECDRINERINLLVVKYSKHKEIVNKRRENYIRMRELLSGIDLVRSYWDTYVPYAPYVFPVIIKNQNFFAKLKYNGVPMWRWEELIQTESVTSSSQRLSLVQLPCHQSLSRRHLDGIVDIIKKCI